MKAEFRRDLQNSYLVLSLKAETEYTYPMRMMMENQIPGLLPCSSRRIDEDILYYYNITSKITLAERCLCRKITGDELLVLIDYLVQALLSMEEYLLDGNSLCLQPDYIYVDVQMKSVSFCYVPGEIWDLEKSFRELLEGLLPFLDHRNQQGVLAGYGLYHYAVQETFSIDGLRHQLEKYKRGGGQTYEEDTDDYESEYKWTDKSGDVNKYEKKKEEICYDQEGIVRKEQMWLEQKKHEAALDAFFRDDGQEEESHPFLVTLGTIGICGFGLLGWYLWRNFTEYLWIWGVSGIIIFIIILFCIWRNRKHAGKKEFSQNREERDALEAVIPKELSSGESVSREEIWKDRKLFSEEKEEMPANISKVIPNYKEEAECLTQLLHQEEGSPIYILEEKYPNAGRQVKLNENDILFIGQLAEVADIVLPSGAVSRIHARIRREGETYYLRDLNSRNGTWVNKQELQGEQEVVIRPGDEIRFADLIYNLRRL